MTLDRDALVLCAGTLPAVSLRERVEAAAEGGFSGVSIFIDDYRRARAEGWSDTDLRRLLGDTGVQVAELDALLRWIPGLALAGDANAEGAAFFRHGEEDFYAVADALGARSLNVVLYSDATLERERIVEAFAGLCDRAAAHDLLVHLEFLPWTQISDVGTALEIVERAGRPNGGLMLDSWHHFRSGLQNEDLQRVPGERILAVQLSDAPREPEPDPVEETLRRRLIPGEGDIGLIEILRILDALEAPAPIGVEIFSETLATKPAKEVARLAGDAVRRLRIRARGRR